MSFSYISDKSEFFEFTKSQEQKKRVLTPFLVKKEENIDYMKQQSLLLECLA